MRSLRNTWLVGLLALLFVPLAACESSPCSGEDCPDACGGGPCEAPPGSAANEGRYTGCSADGSCDTAHGFACVDGLCRYACDAHSDCESVGICTSFARGTFCSPSEQPEPAGHFYSNCPTGGECDEDGDFYCVGAGVGDLDSYCTRDCGVDDDCPTGFFCESTGVTPCADICNVAGDASDPDCIPSSEIGDGQRYRCTEVGPVRDQCVKRRFCAECESDDDCRAVPGQICARDLSGSKICTPPCDPAADSCPWGNAALCGVWDEERGIATCTHRFGSCRGDGAPCEPCVRDKDCASSGFCYGSTFTGERYCLDFSDAGRCSCLGETVSGGVCQGGGCPRTPGDLQMLCFVGADATNTGLCYGANTADNPLLNSPQTGCWPPL